MPPRRDDGDRDRPSWREIDRKKDRSHHVDKTDPYAKARGGPRGRPPGPTSGYKAALDNFFDGGELPDKFKELGKKKGAAGVEGEGSKRQAALRSLRDAVGSAEVTKATKALLDLDGELPRDADVLVAVLQHPDESILCDALRRLLEMHAERPLKRRELLRQRVRKVEDLAEEKDTAELAAELRRALG